MPMLEAPSRRRHGGTAVIAPHPVGGKKTVALRLAGGAFAIWGVMTLLGLLLTHVLNKGPVHAALPGKARPTFRTSSASGSAPASRATRAPLRRRGPPAP